MTIHHDNLVFLDFDGVLTSKSDHTYFNADKNGRYSYSEKCVLLLESLCDDTYSKIVISSNWRRYDVDGFWISYKKIKYMNPLKTLFKRIGNRVVSMLPVDKGLTKSKALELWFKSHMTTKNFVILDDDILEGYAVSPYKDHYVHIDSAFGLTAQDCHKAKQILKLS